MDPADSNIPQTIAHLGEDENVRCSKREEQLMVIIHASSCTIWYRKSSAESVPVVDAPTKAIDHIQPYPRCHHRSEPSNLSRPSTVSISSFWFMGHMLAQRRCPSICSGWQLLEYPRVIDYVTAGFYRFTHSVHEQSYGHRKHPSSCELIIPTACR